MKESTGQTGKSKTATLPDEGRDPQLLLKITPPRIPKTVMERYRLSSKRPEFADKAVVVFQAIAGSGKTSLLAQWRKEALQAGVIVAWLTLDALDDDNRFALGLIEAMRASSGRPGFGQSWIRDAGLGLTPLAAVTEWLAEVADIASDVLLVLDEVNSLPDATLNSSLIYLLLNAPANLKIVVASRKSIALPIAELLSRGRFAAIEDKDFRFDLNETIALLRARFGQRIDFDSCVRLFELTEGWPLGVQLMVSTIERSQNLHEAIARFSVRASDIHRYFVECLVNQLPEPMARFLVRVSFVDALSASLCEAITGEAGCGERLDDLCNRTPIFLEGMEGEWLRIHPLAREFLLERFAKLPEDEIREYNARAGRWLADNGLYEAAARHMLRAGQDEIAYDLVERCLYDVALSGQVSLTTFWTERLPMAEIMRRTSLRLIVGWMLALSERNAEAPAMVAAINNDASADVGDRCESAQICATAAYYADDIVTLEQVVSTCYQTLPAQSPLHQVVGANLLSIITLYRGAPDQARYTYNKVPDSDAAGHYALAWRDWAIGLSYLWEGRVELGAEKLRPCLARAEGASGRRSPAAVMLAALLAAILWESNQTEEAAALIANRLDILERRTPPDAIAMGYVTAARIEMLGRRAQYALDLLDYLYAMGEARRLPRLCIISLGERMRMHALNKQGDICQVVARKLDELVAQTGAERWGPLEPIVALHIGLARAYAAAARQAWQQALAQLNAIAPIAERLRRGHDTVQIHLLTALALKRCGDDGTTLLKEALGLARLWGLNRILADTHPDLPDWVRQLAIDSPESVASGAHVGGAVELPTSSTEAQLAVRIRVAKSSLLSPKEREVLQLLAGNLSNKQIGLAMGVSDETIKWHLKNLFGKLNAGSRKHLLARARLVGILDH